MSASGPMWDDVRFDFRAAMTAVEELKRAASILESVSNQRASAAPKAQAHWRGPYAEQFSSALAQSLQQAGGLVAALNSLAGGIAQAQQQAVTTQQARVQSRIDYWNQEAKTARQRADLANTAHDAQVSLAQADAAAARAAAVQQAGYQQQIGAQAQIDASTPGALPPSRRGAS